MDNQDILERIKALVEEEHGLREGSQAAGAGAVTQPGTVYASEAFAAALAAAGQGGFTLEYIGRLPLAKAYGESTIYRLDRA